MNKGSNHDRCALGINNIDIVMQDKYQMLSNQMLSTTGQEQTRYQIRLWISMLFIKVHRIMDKSKKAKTQRATANQRKLTS